MSVVTLVIHVDDITSATALFDRLQVWKSPSEIGPYVEITAPTSTRAKLENTIEGPWVISSQDLIITIDNADPTTVTFTGSDPIELVDVLNQINSKIPDIATETGPDTDKIALTSPTFGTGSSVKVSGSAAPLLGFSLDKVNGRVSRITLNPVTEDYEFKDFDGEFTDFYKSRFFSTITNSVSVFSDPRQGITQRIIPDSLLSKATATFSDPTGIPLVNRRVIFVPITPILVDIGKTVSMLPGFDRTIITTDFRGFMEVLLIRGQTVKVFIEGSSFSREFVVPDQAEFDLMQLLSTKPDPFSIVQAPPRPIVVS